MEKEIEKYVLLDAQSERKMELHVAFYDQNVEEQIVCTLPEDVILELVRKKVGISKIPLPSKFEIDVDVKEHIIKKYSLELLSHHSNILLGIVRKIRRATHPLRG